MNLNHVVVTGNLTRDAELRELASGTKVCQLRVAVNSRERDPQTRDYRDRPNYFDVSVWGAQGESCATYLAKGRPVAIDGELRWREWEAQDGSKRQAVSITANKVQFLGSPRDTEQNGSGAAERVAEPAAQQAQAQPAHEGGEDDDLPF